MAHGFLDAAPIAVVLGLIPYADEWKRRAKYGFLVSTDGTDHGA